MHKAFCLLFLLSMPLIAMDLDLELLEQEQKKVQLKQIKIELQNAVENKDLNTVLSIFDEHFTKDSILIDYKKDAQKIVVSYVQEAIQEEYIIGLCTGSDVLKIADRFNFYTNDFLHLLEEINTGIQWLRTGECTEVIDEEQIINDWKRIAEEYIIHAFQKKDNYIIDKILATYAQSLNKKLKPHLIELRRFTLHALDSAQLTHQNTPLTNTPQTEDIEEESYRSDTQSMQESCENEVFEKVAEFKQAQSDRLTNQVPVINQVSTEETAQVTEQTSAINWIQKHPFILGAGVVALCAGFYAYVKNKKADNKPDKKSKQSKPAACC